MFNIQLLGINYRSSSSHPGATVTALETLASCFLARTSSAPSYLASPHYADDAERHLAWVDHLQSPEPLEDVWSMDSYDPLPIRVHAQEILLDSTASAPDTSRAREAVEHTHDIASGLKRFLLGDGEQNVVSIAEVR